MGLVRANSFLGRRERSRGTMVVEAAIVFPILLLLTFAVIEYSWLFLKFQHVTNAARQGARVGVRAYSLDTEWRAEVQSVLAEEGITDYSLTASVNPEGAQPGVPIEVTLTVPYASIALLNLPLIPVPENLQASITLMKEGP